MNRTGSCVTVKLEIQCNVEWTSFYVHSYISALVFYSYTNVELTTNAGSISSSHIMITYIIVRMYNFTLGILLISY